MMKTKESHDPKSGIKVGADFTRLPEDEQAKIVNDLFRVGSKWSFLSDLMKAKPERKIAIFRELKNLTQARLAELAKIRQADVSMAEKSVDSVKYGILRKIARGLNVPLKNILF